MILGPLIWSAREYSKLPRDSRSLDDALGVEIVVSGEATRLVLFNAIAGFLEHNLKRDPVEWGQ